MTLEPGRWLANRYRIKQQIGEGRFGIVYLARDANPALPQDVAIKELSHSTGGLGNTRYQNYRRRFELEMQIMNRCSHSNIVRVYNVIHENEALYCILEYVPGGSLRDKLARMTLVPDEAAMIGLDICGALQETARHQVVHRDIKPSNIILTSDGRAKLTDFGVAQTPEEADERRTGNRMDKHPGTKSYMSPEQRDLCDPLDIRSDLYALGLVLYEACTGIPYWPEEHPLPKSVPSALRKVILKALKDKPDQRFQTPEEMQAALEYSRERVNRVEPTTHLPKLLGIAGSVAVIALLVIILFSIGPFSPLPSPTPQPSPGRSPSVKFATATLVPGVTDLPAQPEATSSQFVSANMSAPIILQPTAGQRFTANENVVLEWAQPDGQTLSDANQSYQVWIAFQDQSGQQIVANFPSGKDTQVTLLREQFFENGQPRARDGKYEWSVSIAELASGADLKEISPRTSTFVFFWSAEIPTPVPPRATATSTPVVGPPTPDCGKGRYWNPVMNRCQGEANSSSDSTPVH